MERVEGKVAVVTGGGSNIGRAISRVLAREGAQVCIFDVDREAGQNTVELIKDAGGRAAFFRCDVTAVDEIQKSIKEVMGLYDRLDILVNNVGLSRGTTLQDIDESIFQRNVDANLKSAVFCTKAALSCMVAQRGGAVVFISSINALLGGFSEVAYAASKGGIHSLVKGLVADYSPYGIRFNVVCPGSIPGTCEVWGGRERSLNLTSWRVLPIYIHWGDMARRRMLPLRCCFWRPMKPAG